MEELKQSMTPKKKKAEGLFVSVSPTDERKHFSAFSKCHPNYERRRVGIPKTYLNTKTSRLLSSCTNPPSSPLSVSSQRPSSSEGVKSEDDAASTVLRR